MNPSVTSISIVPDTWGEREKAVGCRFTTDIVR